MNKSDQNKTELGGSFDEYPTKFEVIEFSPGVQVDKYILQERIGAGGMGTVYLARHARLTSRLYAIKFIKPGLVGKNVQQRFEAEIDALEKIQHPNFVFAHDAGRFRDIIYLVMEFVDGFSLSEILDEHSKLPFPAAAEIIRQTAAGLQHAHDQGLVHRDIKPSNLVLSKDGTVKILDLGLARFCDPNENHGLTGTFQILGTPDYMSPEQCRSSVSVDIRSDIYSLGCTLYRLITGKAPFGDAEHSSIANKIAAHLTEKPKPVQSFVSEIIPNDFVDILNKMLAKKPDERFQTPAELLAAIEPFTDVSELAPFLGANPAASTAQVNTKSLQAPMEETETSGLDVGVNPKSKPVRVPSRWFVAGSVLITFSAIFFGWYFLTGNDSHSEPVKAGVASKTKTEPGESPNGSSGKSDAENKGEHEPEQTERIGGQDSQQKTPNQQTDFSPEPSFLAAQVKQIFRSNCFECHGDTRRESDIHVFERDSYIDDGMESIISGDVDGSYVFELISTSDEDIRMPKSPLAALTTDQVEVVRKWIEAGAPAFPDDVQPPTEKQEDDALAGVVGAEYVLSQLVEFLELQPREDRPYFRFFSSNNALTAGATKEELKTQQQALAKAINHLSMQPTLVRPTVVDAELETIFAVDIRKLGWQRRPFLSEAGQESDVDLFDLVLLEYPYSIAFSDSTNFEQLWDLFMERSDMVRPIPYLRIDWFVSVATQFPLYEDILGLPIRLHELEEMIGVDSEMNMRDFVAKRAGMTVSGVSQNNRVVERHPARYGSYWKSYDFETSKGRQNMFVDPMHFDFAGGEMIFNLPNGLQGYLITDTQGNRINAAPTSIVTDKFAPDKTVRNGLACMRCHDKGMKRFADNIRPAIENLPGGSMFDKKDILRLYPIKKEMDELLDIDEGKFLAAMEQVLGEPQEREPLADISRGFIDNAIALEKAASELGLKDTGSLKSIFALPQFTRFGLASLTEGGVIRRDTWEDYFDRIVNSLGIGIPLAPVDGLIREDHLADEISSGLVLKTNKRNNIFSPGEKLIVTIDNRTGVDLFIEVIGTGIEGNIQRLFPGVVRLQSGQSKQLPNAEGLEIQPKLGAEKITLFASPSSFEPGLILRPKDESTFVADRFVHENWYQFDPSASPSMDVPQQLIKKTLIFETR